jgi:hypothetical protein
MRRPIIVCSRIFLTLAVLLLSVAAANAQSGRRSTNTSTGTNTNSNVSPAPGAKTAEAKPAAEPRVRLVVGIDRANAFTTTPYYVYDTVMQECIRHLNDANIVFANSGGSSMNRSEAIKLAKGETQRWVINLEVRSLYADSGRQIKPEQDELFVEYTVIEPVTGKIKHSGRTQHHIYQSGGRNSIPTSARNVGNYSEYSIKQAVVEAADKILADFDIKIRE